MKRSLGIKVFLGAVAVFQLVLLILRFPTIDWSSSSDWVRTIAQLAFICFTATYLWLSRKEPTVSATDHQT